MKAAEGRLIGITIWVFHKEGKGGMEEGLPGGIFRVVVLINARESWREEATRENKGFEEESKKNPISMLGFSRRKEVAG